MSEVHFECVFCGGDVRTMGGTALLHSEPACEDFMRLDPLDFLKETNNILHGKKEAERLRSEDDES